MSETLFEAGLAVRREVLGNDHVERAMASADALFEPLQHLVTEYCWGAVWTRPGLDRRTRSLLNVGMLTALGRSDEVELHVRGAVRNGCTDEQIVEALLQAAVYCGVPAALTGMRAARRALAALTEDDRAAGRAVADGRAAADGHAAAPVGG